MPDYAVATAFTGKDKVSQVFAAMEKAAGRYGNSASDAMRKVGKNTDHAAQALRNATKHGYNFGAIFKGMVAANALRDGLGVVKNAVTGTINQFLDFDDTMVQAAVKFDEIGYSSKNFGEQLTNLKNRTLELTKGTKFMPVDAAKAINTLSASGYSVEGAMAGAKSSMYVATAVGEDLATTVDNLSGMMGAFGLRSKDAAEEMRNFNKLGNVMTMAANLSNVSVSDLKETMEQAGPVSRAMGVELEEVAAMAAILGNASIKGTEGATALKNIMLSLANKDKAAEIGLNIGGLYDDAGKLKKVSRIVFESFNQMKKVGMKPLEIAGKFNELFGLRGIAGATNIATAIDQVQEAMGKLKNPGDIAKESAKVVADYSARVKLATLTNTLFMKSFEVFDAFAGNGKSGIDNLIEKIKKFDMKPIIDALTAAGNVIGTLYNIIKPLLPVLPYMAAGWLLWRSVLFTMPLLMIAGQSLFVFTTLQAGLGTVGAMSTAFSTLAASLSAAQVAMVALVGAFAWYSAIKSAFTGKDNVFSEMAQNIGLVPKLSHDADGHVTGYAADQAPNMTEAELRQRGIQFQGQLNIAGAPPGSTVTSSTMGAPPLNVNMMGPQ